MNAVDTITKDQFLEYLKARKSLDSKYGKTIISKFSVHQEKVKISNERQRDRYFNDDDYRSKLQEKSRARYDFMKSKKKVEVEPPTPTLDKEGYNTQPHNITPVSDDDIQIETPFNVFNQSVY